MVSNCTKRHTCKTRCRARAPWLQVNNCSKRHTCKTTCHNHLLTEGQVAARNAILSNSHQVRKVVSSCLIRHTFETSTRVLRTVHGVSNCPKRHACKTSVISCCISSSVSNCKKRDTSETCQILGDAAYLVSSYSKRHTCKTPTLRTPSA